MKPHNSKDYFTALPILFKTLLNCNTFSVISHINTTYTLRSTVLLALVYSDGPDIAVAAADMVVADDPVPVVAVNRMVLRPISLIFSVRTSSSLLASS